MEKGASKNVELVGYHDLEGRPAFKIALQVVRDRWYMYLSHFWTPGWSILEVTEPSEPRLLRFIPGPENTWTLQVQVAEGIMVTSLEKIMPGWGGDPEGSFEEGAFIWDVRDPVEPRLMSHFKTGALGTHRNHWEGGRYLHLAATAPGFSGHIYRILDAKDPENPFEVGRWWLPEQWEAGGGRWDKPLTSLHGPPYIEGDRAYLGYGGAGMVILDVSDVRLPRLVSKLDFHPPLGSRLALHTALPLPGRKLAVVNSEAIEEGCAEPINFAGLVDIRDERRARLVSLLPVPEPPPDSPHKNFCQKGGRFGPHNQHHPQHQPHLEDRDDRVYLTYFNAGLRIYDIGDPLLPRETGYYVPPDPKERRGVLPKELVTQTEDVLVDSRGYIYITDKNHGLHVLRYTGD